jgi:hypothetical protein
MGLSVNTQASAYAKAVAMLFFALKKRNIRLLWETEVKSFHCNSTTCGGPTPFPRHSQKARPWLSPALGYSHYEILSTLILRISAIRLAIAGVSLRLPLS